MSVSLSDFIRGLPKAELHLHIEGTLEPELMFALAARNGVSLPYADIEAARRAYDFANLQEFLDLYYAGAQALRTRRDFHDLAMAYFRRLHADGGVHAEIFFDPQTHTARGVPFADVVEGLLSAMTEAERELGVTCGLILSFLRHLSEDDAFATWREAQPWREKFVGVGLDSSEVGHPPSKFARVFAEVRRCGLKVLAHAGEEGPPEYVYEALDSLHVDRIDHGNRALENADLTARLVREGMTLTICPLSNLKLCVVRDLRDHPMKRMLALGLRATINSDDPAYFGGYLLANYVETAQALSLTRADLVQLAKNSFTGSFLPQAEIDKRLAEIDAYAAENA